jgi:hypothetical protein
LCSANNDLEILRRESPESDSKLTVESFLNAVQRTWKKVAAKETTCRESEELKGKNHHFGDDAP